MFVEARLCDMAQPELEAGESLLWAGQPAPTGFVVRALPVAGFGAVWTAFTGNFIYLWFFGGAERQVSGPHGLFGLHGILASLFFVSFALIGLGALLSPVWQYFVATRTLYAMTPKRVLIIERGWSRKVRSYSGAEIGFIERTERADGAGDLTFAHKPTKDSEGDPTVEEVKLVGIRDVRAVEALLRETFLESREGGE